MDYRQNDNDKRVGESFEKTVSISLNPKDLFRFVAKKTLSIRSFLNTYKILSRTVALLSIALILLGVISDTVKPIKTEQNYNLSSQVQNIIGQPVERYADMLKFDSASQIYNYNNGYALGEDFAGTSSKPKFSAVMHADPTKGIEVIDPSSKTNVTIKPQFDLAAPRQNKNRLVYPFLSGSGAAVYSAYGTGIKEDIILNQFQGDELKFKYNLTLSSSMEARIENNGSLSIYGPEQLLLGNISTGSKADEQLLQKARDHAQKTNLLYSFPAPYVKENNKTESLAKARYFLNGNELVVTVNGLNKATYPLSVDPSVYVESAAKFMRGNNETNIDFDTTNELIQKGVLTGARFESWTSSTALNAARWGGATVVAGGYIYIIGGSSGTTNFGNVYWAKLNTSTYTIDSPNPGNGACTNWCTLTAYDLPVLRRGLSAVAYNGYLYAIGGKDGTTCTGTNNICGTVYYAKVGANGEPINWTATTSLVTDRMNAGAVAYNNRIYVAGGQTDASLNGDSTVEYASVKPDGSLSSWSTTGMISLSSIRWGFSLLQYNNFLYLVGGSSTTTVAATVEYIKIKTDGTLDTSWTATSSFTTARASYGGNFATIWGGYMYIDGGCSAMTTTNCSTIISGGTAQLASINADGTVTDWTSLTGVTHTLAEQGLVTWRNTIYSIGGCSVATATSNCGTTVTTTQYAHFKTDGDVSPKQAETTLPTMGNAAGQVGRTSSGIVVNNGYIYNIGGCANVGCTTMSDNSASAPINADGSLGAWTVDSTGTLNGTAGLGAFGVTVYNNVVYVVGGTDGQNNWENTISYATLDSGGPGILSTWTQSAGILSGSYGYQFVFAKAASATTGNLFVISGCSTNATGVGCSTYENDVLKCIITNSTGAPTACSTTANGTQLQLQDLDANTAGTQGLGLTAGAVWGDYIYLAGGACGSSTVAGATPELISCDGVTTTGSFNRSEINKVYVAKIDSSNNIVAAGINGNTEWQIASNTLPQVRRREVAFAVNGYLYVAAGHDGTTGVVDTLSDITYAKIDPTTGDLGAFNWISQSGSTNNIISPRWNLGYVEANGYLYFVGGCTTGDPPASCSAMAGTVESVQVYNNYSGSPKLYSTTNTVNVDRVGGSATVLNGYIYFAGGCSAIACGAGTATSTVFYALINPNGTVGSATPWSTGGALPATRAWGTLLSAGGTLYYIGGQDSTNAAVTTVYYTTGISSGNPTWSGTAASNGLPLARTMLGAAVFNNRIYVTGGETGGTTSTKVYYSPSLSAGGNITSAWTDNTANVFTTARSGHVTVAYGSTLYVIGGYSGTTYLMDVQYAPIDANGSVGAFSQGTTLPRPIRNGDGFAANGYLYLFGGRSAATTCTNATYVAPIIGYPPGSSERYGIGIWSQTNVTYTTARYGLSAAYGNGRVYLMGGGCAAMVPSGDRTYYSTLQSQPQLSAYSLMIDTDSDVTPLKWLMNGIDNGIGAQWIFNYQSSTATNNAWGCSTAVGGVTLGTPGTYTPKDVGCAGTNTARYYYLYVTIDASQAFGYPEDVTRGPTIADLTLEFTSDPSKRLIHGKTFTGGVQQPLDTPF